MNRVHSALWLLALAFAGVCAPADAATICGPGPHWLDTCTSGTDSFPSAATVGIDLDLNDTADLTIVLSGPTTIFRGAPLDTPDPLDLNHFNRIDIEIVSLSLTGAGVTLTAGDGLGNLANDGPLYSPGAIIEKTGLGTVDCSFAADPALACSFFDVFFQIAGPFGVLHNNDPLRIEAMISGVPPIGIPYVHNIPGPISLLNDQQVEIARLVNATHIPTPESTPLTLIISGIAALGLLASRRRRGEGA